MVKFNEIKTREDFAKCLRIDLRYLTFILYKKGPNSCYKSFLIPKRNGEQRLIEAPLDCLKQIQRRLMQVIWDYQQSVWNERGTKRNISHAFEKGKNIISNAQIHKNKRYVICFDLKDFFDSFHFGRVSGFFINNQDYKLPKEIAIIIAQLTCYKGKLPQGAPSSPIITNLICQIMDMRILKIAKKYRLDYTRYADDLTFSTNRHDFLNDRESFILALEEEITNSGFCINSTKTRLIYNDSRQIVTGLVVNKKVNISNTYYKETRAMLNSLFCTGCYELNDGQKGTLNQIEGRLSFLNQIEHFKNKYDASGKKHDSRCLSSREKLYRYFLFYKYFVHNEQMVIFTEGKTDIRYLKSALKSYCSKYPALVKKKGSEFEFAIKFIYRSNKWKYLFGISVDGADSMSVLYEYFVGCNGRENIFKFFSKKAFFSHVPVCFLFDNERCTKRPLKKFINNQNFCIKPDQIKELDKENMIILNKQCNLNLVTVPLQGNKDESEIEDLFTKETLETEIGGRSFSKKDEDKEICYNKDIFSKYVYSNYEKIDFSGFLPLLDILNNLAVKS